MSLNLIIGRSGSGKSKYLYEQVLKDEEQGYKVLVFVPDFVGNPVVLLIKCK